MREPAIAPLQRTVVRYLFGLAAVASTFALRIWLTPLTGRGAPFVLFFAAVLVTCVVAGVGPGLLAVSLTVPLAIYTFVLRDGYVALHAVFQSLFFALDGVVVVYFASVITRGRQSIQDWNRQLQSANEEARRAAQHARELLDLAPEAFFLADLNGQLVDVNQAACRMLGYERSELVGRTIFDIIPDEDAWRLKAQRKELLTPGRAETAEWTQIRKDGTLLPVEVSANILSDGRWQAFARDIRTRKQSEIRERTARLEIEAANEQLRESEERFRLTVDEAPIGMALVALDGRFVRVNRVLCEIVGYTPDELTKLTFQSITHPEDVAADVGLAECLARGEIPRCQLEKRYVRKDGSIVNVMLSSSMLRGRDGEALYYISQIEDITERKRGEEALRASEAKFSGIVSIAADAIITVDKDQRITLFNEGATKIFGHSESEVIGEDLGILIPERFRAMHSLYFARYAESVEGARKMGERQEIFGLRKNGEEFPAEASISRVTAGGTTSLCVVLRDITLRQNIEKALRRAVAARDRVLSIVVHDLRNPLNNINVACGLLRRPRTEHERRNQKPLDMIARAARRMSRMVEDLLDVTRLEAGQLKLERGRLPANDLGFEAVEMQTTLASTSGVEVRFAAGRDVPDIWGDRDRLLQVLENLIGNAIKFTQPGGQITVSTSSTTHEVLFAIADTGCGIAPENISHVFDRFWQATSRAGKLGAGLGLPITKGIIEAHCGRIWVRSTVGRGSTFYFTIPKASSLKAA